MQEEKWWKEHERITKSGIVVFASNVPAILQEHTERIIKEIEGMKIPSILDMSVNNQVHNAALDAVINHLKKEYGKK